MTIDERLERLAERHEALIQSVELLQVMQRDNEERWEKRFGQVLPSSRESNIQCARMLACE